MKILLLTAALMAATAFSAPNAFSADAAAGEGVFKANCAQCHGGGKNVVNPPKALTKANLEKYGMYSPEAIIRQVTQGKASMPAFRGRLNPQQIENVAAYVLKQAENGWK